MKWSGRVACSCSDLCFAFWLNISLICCKCPQVGFMLPLIGNPTGVSQKLPVWDYDHMFTIFFFFKLPQFFFPIKSITTETKIRLFPVFVAVVEESTLGVLAFSKIRFFCYKPGQYKGFFFPKKKLHFHSETKNISTKIAVVTWQCLYSLK